MDFIMNILTGLFKIDEQINNFNRNFGSDERLVIEEDVAYTERQMLDIQYRKDMTDICRPIVINIHGGGWLVGDKKWRKGIASMYAKEGFFVVNPNYSLSPTYRYPECIRDIFKLCDWLEDNKEKYNIDTSKIFMTGDSAGAHLTAVVGGLQNSEKTLKSLSVNKPKYKISKVALFCGVYDFDRCIAKPGAEGLVKEMTGYDYKRYKKEFPYYKELSPINFVDENYPETYMVSAPFDIFCDGQAKRMEAKLKAKHIKYTHYIPQDKLATHCFHLNLFRRDSREAIDGAIKMFKADTVLADYVFDETTGDRVTK